ncbi:unnamed protein product [Leptosia nina]|uniref:Uncharacterized protein n=1 Tax=Leptosia nina TaxID=320188 RepID=A0AAV1IXU4_9NEOP
MGQGQEAGQTYTRRCVCEREVGVTAWVLGWLMCKTVPYVQGLSVAASVYSLVAVSLDRESVSFWCGGHKLDPNIPILPIKSTLQLNWENL